MSKVVSIKAHPKFRDVSAIRRYLSGSQEEFGTKVDLTDYYDLQNPEVQQQLKELNLWCEALKEMPPGTLPKPKLVDLSDVLLLPSVVTGKLNAGLGIGLKKGDLTMFAAMPDPLAPRYSAGNYIRMTHDYMVKGRDDASPDA
jgi:hypothetical protein